MGSPRPAASTSEADEPAKSKTSSPERAIAFLVHSPESVANNLPPDCDNKPLARQRRRRTSPDDQRILEEAFARNPRPSREQRADIINKVALGDKEVQIWFQNRRQSSRRKAKPLDIQDLNASFSGSSSAPSSPIDKLVEVVEVGQKEAVTDEIEVLDGAPDKNPDESGEGVSEVVKADQEHEMTVESNARSHGAAAETQATTITSCIASSQAAPSSTLPTDLGSSQSFASSSQDAIFSSITKPTYLANRRSASFVRQHADGPTTISAQPVESVGRVPGLKKSGSYLRLSMSEDGQARVIDRSAPSPPRSQPLSGVSVEEPAPVGGLRRSYSAAGLNDLFRQSTPQSANRTKVPRVSQAGRSRDSRAWEFWCDSEARNSLVNKADQENSGSAANAIGLIRQSSKNALRPSSRKANHAIINHGSFPGTDSGLHKAARPKLQRSKTTQGRLQDSNKKDATEDPYSPGGDSDKENWDPDENEQSSRRQPLATNLRRSRTVLGENAQIPSYATSLGGLMESEKKRRAIADRPPAAVDAEVAAFMGSETGSQNDDLDCVQSLLSLSKGNWR